MQIANEVIYLKQKGHTLNVEPKKDLIVLTCYFLERNLFLTYGSPKFKLQGKQ